MGETGTAGIKVGFLTGFNRWKDSRVFHSKGNSRLPTVFRFINQRQNEKWDITVSKVR
tara:strand:+ start:75 stop:248 length:174 start_codon:yes stop_codon:yes gene_type:complete